MATTVSRVVGLGRPAVPVFDEIFYVDDAIDVIDGGLAEVDAPHPMAGAQLLALGIRLFGLEPWSWRLAPVVAGVLVVWLTVIAARGIGVRPWLALLAGGLVALDGVAFVTGRLALLDGMAALPTTALVALLVNPRPAGHRRWWLRVAIGGLLMGAALAIKWTVAPLVAVAVLFAVGPIVGRRVAAVAVLLIMALAVYGAAHLEWFVNDEVALSQGHCSPDDCGLATRTGALLSEQAENLRFHRRLVPTNPSAAPIWAWPLANEPTVLFQKQCTSDMVAANDRSDGVCTQAPSTVAVVALANPIVWLGGLATALWLVLRTAVAGTRRSSMAAGLSESPPDVARPPAGQATLVAPGAVVAFVALYAVVGRDGYSFYAAPIVPALALSMATFIDRLPESWRRATGGAAALGSLVLFSWAWPVLAARPVGDSGPGRALLDLLGL